jgi:hypothetical protein
VQLHPQLRQPFIALLDLALKLIQGRALVAGRFFRRARSEGLRRVLQLRELCVALQELAPQTREPRLVFLRLFVEVLGALAPIIDFLLSELLGPRLGDLELLLELRDLYAFCLGNFLEMAGLLIPVGALGLDLLETVRQDVELLFDLVLRGALALQLLVQFRRARFRIAERVLQQGERLFG